jgi:aldehyde dehydrogenase (NAD+)
LTISKEAGEILDELGVAREAYRDGSLEVQTPITGEVIGSVRAQDDPEVNRAIQTAHVAFREWRSIPAPKRGELVRLLGEELRASKAALGRLVTIEAGKIISEGLGEVQEMIDICTFAAGLSRQLHGLTIATERPDHRMMETWHPLGVTGIISAFNFPVAVWAWNTALALVCGNPVVWKPSEKTPLCALAAQALFERAALRFGAAPLGLSAVFQGGQEVGEALVNHPLVLSVSATGSTAMGRQVAPKLAARFARSILELGGNNAAIVCPSADLELALRGIAFAAMGTAGQRCTTLRRLLVQEGVYEALVPRLKQVYASVRVGDPRDAETLVGPLIDGRAFEAMQASLAEAEAAGGIVTGGGRVNVNGCEAAFYARAPLWWRCRAKRMR